MNHSRAPFLHPPATTGAGHRPQFPAPRSLAAATGAALVTLLALSAQATPLRFDRPFGDTDLPITVAPPREVPTVSLTPQAGNLAINIQFLGGLTPSQQTVFSTARDTWQNFLGDYQASVLNAGSRPSPIITAEGINIDGVGGVLGSAGPTQGVSQGGFLLTTVGRMRFDSADLANMEANGSLYDVVLHEMAHVLGFGTLWSLNGVYSAGTGQFTGATALEYYKNEFNQPGATSVPIELQGGAGTADAHWNENLGGAGLTGITQVGTGLDMRNELMTGWLNTPTFVSRTTIASFRDIGFEAIPEPAEYAAAFALLGAAFAWARRRRPPATPRVP
jgi:MYXO-CTERM domain-containing protein